jgi:hypothetical protein
MTIKLSFLEAFFGTERRLHSEGKSNVRPVVEMELNLVLRP